MSGFATISNTNDEAATGMDMPDIDESKMQKAMSMLEKNMDKIDEDDPRQAAKLMRDLTSATGLEMGDSMEEALSTGLRELEADLHRHIHKENSILFPKAIHHQGTSVNHCCARPRGFSCGDYAH